VAPLGAARDFYAWYPRQKTCDDIRRWRRAAFRQQSTVDLAAELRQGRAPSARPADDRRAFFSSSFSRSASSPKRHGCSIRHSAAGAGDRRLAGTMEITERVVDTITILDLRGKLTIGEAAQLLKDKSESLVFQGRCRVIVNLADVPYIDSGGLGQLVACYTTLAKAGGRLKLLKVGTRNHDLLSITKLVSVFDTFDTEREAIDSYAAAIPA
jgi:anti-sigma B factor antagonist